MRAFYIDQDEDKVAKLTTYYVKIGNVYLPDDLKGYKSIEATNTQDLIKKIIEVYKFPKNDDIKLELWSNQMYGGVRLDTMEIIPKEHEFIWVRVITNNKGNV